MHSRRLETFYESPEHLHLIQSEIRVLVVGAGGLGCEILKCLIMSGIRQIDIIDMDIIETSNLNRQFVFRSEDIGRPKARVAVERIQERLCNTWTKEQVSLLDLKYHVCRIEEKETKFYSQFNAIICGLDSLQARRYMNSVVYSLVQFNSNEVDESSIIALIDGGTEGFLGSTRLVIPYKTACIECNIDLYSDERRTYPLCTIAHTPRQPEHCIEYCRITEWNKVLPFGEQLFDQNSEEHIEWLHSKAIERAHEFGIQPFSLNQTIDIIRNIIPAVSTTNTMIAAQCVSILLNLCFIMEPKEAIEIEQFVNLNGIRGISMFGFNPSPRGECAVCNRLRKTVHVDVNSASLAEIIECLKVDATLGLSNPAVSLGGENPKLLYMTDIGCLKEATEKKLECKLADLGVVDGTYLIVTDSMHANPIEITVKDEKCEVKLE